MKKIVEQNWDYTKHAKFYEYRPNYAPNCIDMLKYLVSNNVNGGGESQNKGSRYWSWNW